MPTKSPTKSPANALNNSPNYFIALRLSPNSSERLQQNVEQLKKWDLTAEWTHPQDYHITVSFLGPLTHEEVHLIPSAIDLLVSSWKRPPLTFAGLGARAGRHLPQSVYVALSDPQGICQDFHRDLNDALEVRDARPFLPHVTLCRPRSSAREAQEQPRWYELFSAFGVVEWGACECDELALFVRRKGAHERDAARYHVVTNWSLPSGQ
jgi:RNA 2',3'-cyclic 3'-phosphodiesterase